MDSRKRMAVGAFCAFMTVVSCSFAKRVVR